MADVPLSTRSLAVAPRPLVPGHELSHEFPILFRIFIAARIGDTEPLISLHVILFYAVAL